MHQVANQEFQQEDEWIEDENRFLRTKSSDDASG